MKTSSIISLSVDRIIDEVMAETAVRHLLNPKSPRPLDADHAEALHVLIRCAFASVSLALIPHITDSADDIPSGRLSMTISPALASEAAAAMLGRAVEHAIARHVLYDAICGVDASLADKFHAEFCRLADRCRSMANLMPTAARARIRPSWY